MIGKGYKNRTCIVVRSSKRTTTTTEAVVMRLAKLSDTSLRLCGADSTTGPVATVGQLTTVEAVGTRSAEPGHGHIHTRVTGDAKTLADVSAEACDVAHGSTTEDPRDEAPLDVHLVLLTFQGGALAAELAGVAADGVAAAGGVFAAVEETGGPFVVAGLVKKRHVEVQ